MNKDTLVTFRISQEEYARWKVEAEKRKTDISKFIRDCVFRVIAGAEDNRVLSELSDIKKAIDFKPLTTELAELKRAIVESTNILEGKRAEMLRIARETSDPNDNKVILDYLKTRGKSTLNTIVKETGLEEHVVFKALQMLVELDTVIMNMNKRPTMYEAKI